jgi:Na+/H+-dicarboxylate symporter
MKSSSSRRFVKNYAGIGWLLGGVLLGSLLGLFFRERILWIRPLGDIFLNLLFTAVIPLVFFAIASAIARLSVSRETGRLMGVLIGVFTGTVLFSIVLTMLGLFLFPITQHIPAMTATAIPARQSIGEQLVQLLTAGDFVDLLSRKSMLALLLFSLLTGAAARRAGAGGEAFRAFLFSGNEVMKNLLQLIMKGAPIGLGAYFAYQVAVLGPQLFGVYSQTLLIAHGISLFYYLFVFTAYAGLAGGAAAILRYWKNNVSPSVTALGTCSSIASIPANLEAAGKMGIPAALGDITIPLGASLHKEGSAIAAVVKVAVALALVHKAISGWDTILLAGIIALLVSVIEGGIPNGGYVGQLLIVSAYHLPPGVLPVIMIIGTLLDPVATLLNVTGDTVAALLITRFLRSTFSKKKGV